MTERQLKNINRLMRKAMKAKRNGALGLIQNKHKTRLTARVMTNVAKPWWGNAALTVNIGRE